MSFFGNKEEKMRVKVEKEEMKKEKQRELILGGEEKIKKQKKTIKNMKAAKEHLEDGEQIIDYVFGMYASKMLGGDTKRNGVLIATNQRIIFYGKKKFGYNMESIDYGKISSIEYSRGMIFGKIKIYTSGNDITFETSMEQTARKIMAVIKEKTKGKPSVKTTTTNIPEKTPIEQLKEYKELLDLEIITQEEFDAKKKQLLDN